MKNSFKKILLTIIAMITIASILLSTNILTKDNFTFKKAVAEETAGIGDETVIVPNVTVSAKSSNIFSGYIMPDNSNYIYFDVMLNRKTTVDVRVRYHLEDRSACAGSGDYCLSEYTGKETLKEKEVATHDQQEVKINAGDMYGQIGIYVPAKTYMIAISNSVNYYRNFVLVIDEVINGNMPTETTFICNQKCINSNDTRTNSNGYYFCEYTDSEQTTNSSGKNDWSYGYSSIVKSSGYEKLVVTNYGTIYCKCYIEKDRWNGINVNPYESFFYLGALKDTLISYDTVSEFWNHDFNCSPNQTVTTKYVKAFDFESYKPYLKEQDNQQSGGLPSSDNYIKVPYTPSSDANKFKVSFVDHTSFTSKSEFWVYGKIRDVDAPYSVALYADGSTNGKVRIGIRFSEVVQVKDGSKVAVIASLSGRKTKFDYVGGSLTDTLYFEADITKIGYAEGNTGSTDSNLKITNVTVDDIQNANLITDLGYNLNGSPNEYSKKLSKELGKDLSYNCNIDLRYPEISATITQTAKISQTKTVNVTISKMEKGKLYYIWKTTNETPSTDPSDYTGMIDCPDKVSGDSRTLLINGSSMTGEYYLHVLAISQRQRATAYVVGREYNEETKNAIEGLLFDNTVPTITDQSVIWDALNLRTFNISSTDGINEYDSGLSKIYAYIAKGTMQERMPYEIWNSQSFDEGKIQMKNNVYMLDDGLKQVYSYKNISNNNKIEVRTTDYSGVTLRQAFSSKNAAIEYFKFMEYMDLQIVQVTQGMQEAFEGDDVNTQYVKADGETHEAEFGAWWIRYKVNGFDPYTSKDNEGNYSSSLYVYYYYCDSTVETQKINIDSLSDLLVDALEANAKNIASHGVMVDLTKEGYIDENKMPYLEPNQQHYEMIKLDDKTFEYQSTITSSTGKITYADRDLYMSVSGGNGTILLKAIKDGLINLDVGKTETFYIGFFAVDAAGNSSIENTKFVKYRFDTRDLFESECSVTQNGTTAPSFDDNVESYNLDLDAVKFIFKAIGQEEGQIGVGWIKFRGELLEETDYSKYFSIGSPTNNGSQMIITTSEPGFFEIELKYVKAATSKFSKTYSFYLTRTGEEDTLNYKIAQGNNVINNQVYELNSEYYYMAADKTVMHEYYNGTALNATFSSMSKARSYVTFMEYQDVRIVQLTEFQANALNKGGDRNWIKADNESKTAKANQYWVIYKRSYWNINSTDTGWACYYYGEDGNSKITPALFSDNLTKSINSVVEYILSLGRAVDLVGEAYSDDYGASYLSKSQIHYDDEFALVTKTGSEFDGQIVFDGDEDIYQNLINSDIDENKIPLVSNVKLEKDSTTRLFYSNYTAFNDANREWTELTINDLDDGTYEKVTYKEIIKGPTGTYLIREFGLNGVREYAVYVDKTAPVVTISYVSAVEGKTQAGYISSEQDGLIFSAKSFTITSLDETLESDELSYVAIYVDKTYKFVGIYYYHSVNESQISFDTGNYYIEVGDRSGNKYSFIVQVNSEDLIFNVSVVENSYVQASSNRTRDQILSYVVKLNQKIIDTEYTGEIKKYKKSGYYEFTITDIYGNTKIISGSNGSGLEFSRSLPELKWSYLNQNGTYTNYDSKLVTVMNIVEELGGTFYINSAKRLKFQMLGEYSFTITGLEQNEYTINTVNNSVTINSDKDWDMEIWYTEFPEVRATYKIRIDADAPEIRVTYTTNQYVADELMEATLPPEDAKIGDVLLPTTIKYFIAVSSSSSVSNLDIVDSSILRLDCLDKTGVKKVAIYIDGELLQEINPESHVFETVYLGRTGVYKIEAEDMFGNTSTLEFTNSHYDFINMTLEDGTDYCSTVELRKDDILYGNENLTVQMLKNGNIAFKITDKDLNEYFVLYKIENGDVTKIKYVYGEEITSDYTLKEYKETQETVRQLDQQGNIVDKVVTLFSTTDVYYKQNKWYQIASIYDDDNNIKDGANIYCKYDDKGFIYFKVDSRDERTKVEVRCSFEETIEPYYNVVLLSREKTNIILKQNTEDQITTNENKAIIYINSKFFIQNDIDPLITKIEISYSDRRDFKEYTIVYPVGNENSLMEFDTKENGFYSIKITNKFGVVNEYIINRQDFYTLLSVAKYDDDIESRFNSEFDGIVKANKNISIEAYAQYAYFEIYKDGIEYGVIPTLIDGCYYITFTEEGLYRVYTKDNYGNEYNKYFEIKKSDISYHEEFITGYNEKALSKDKGYTNYKLTISKDAMNEYNIKYASIIFDNNEMILFNSLTQYAKDFNEEELVNSIGNNGDGTYTIIFRDEYGSIAKKEIYYRETSPLKVNRRIRSSVDYEYQDLLTIISDGVWSNSSVNFETEATTYQFKIKDNSKGEEYEDTLPQQFAFTTSSGNGKFEYVAYYIDEYGFEYTINVYLVRQTIKIDFNENVVTKTIDEVVTTRNNISLTYSNTAECVYSLNGEPAKKYEQNQVLYKDGFYRFTATDKAGNTTTKTIRKDTVCEFYFIESKTGSALVNGGVANASKVEFKQANNDNVSIKTIYFNGVKQKNSDQIVFTESGKYGILLEDRIGNQTLFEFYNINHGLMEFDYTTPNTYKITEILYDSGDGVSITYMEFVEHTEINSHFYATENGEYTVVMASTLYNDAYEFSFTINNTPPNVSLVGCNEGDVTIESVTISGYEIGDIIYVYKDGELESKTEITSKNVNPPVISDGGNYKIVVENKAGVTTELSFTRTHIPNGAGSALIIVACVSVVIGILVGMLLKNKQKFDE